MEEKQKTIDILLDISNQQKKLLDKYAKRTEELKKENWWEHLIIKCSSAIINGRVKWKRNEENAYILANGMKDRIVNIMN